MHANTFWDVLLAGCLISGGAIFAALEVKQGERLTWAQHLGYTLASIGFVCWGVGWIAIGHGNLYPFILMGTLGSLASTGAFEGTRLSDLFPTFFGRRNRRS